MHAVSKRSNLGLTGIERFALDVQSKKSVGTGAESEVQTVALKGLEADLIGHFAAFESVAVAFDIDFSVLICIEKPTAGLNGLFRTFAVVYVVPAGHELAPVQETVVVDEIEGVLRLILIVDIVTVPFL